MNCIVTFYLGKNLFIKNRFPRKGTFDFFCVTDAILNANMKIYVYI